MDRFLNRAKRILTGLLTISVLAASFPELALATEVVNDVAEVVQSDGLSASEPEGVTEEAAGQVEERDNDNQTQTDGIIDNSVEEDSVPVGSYKFDVTAVQMIRDGENSIIELVPLTKPLTVTFKANAPKAISAKLNNSGKVTIDDTASASAQMPFVSNSAYSSIINTETVKPILYNNNDKGAISSFKKYFDVTVSGNRLILTRKSGDGAKYNWTDAEKKKGEAVIVGWVEYTVVGEDGASKITYCEKVTATLKYKGN